MKSEMIPLMEALKKTIKRLREDKSTYQWGHLGSCNCGHLAQTVTHLSKDEIHELAIRSLGEDWSEKALDYCKGSGYPVEHILTQMMELGLSKRDIVSLEKLDDPQILRELPEAERNLKKNKKEDVITYMEAWVKNLHKG